MVKKFISGILGKRADEPKASENQEEVPDELPPLAEDIASQTPPEPKKEAKTEIAASKDLEKEEVPEELPPLEEGLPDKAVESAEHGTLDDLEKEDIPEAIKKAKLAKIRVPEAKAAAETKPEYIQASREDYTVKERIKSGAEIGFFSNVIDHIKKHGGAKERLLSGDLFSRMDNYWEIRKHEIKTGMPLPAEKKLEEELINRLEELNILEQKWQVQKLALEEDLKFIHEREREIQAKIKELKLVSNELKLFRSLNPEEYFHVHNGVVLKNLHNLIDLLEVIDDETLKFHVKDNKNDFSDWIKHVFKDNKLADNVKNAKTKMEMIKVLETVPVNNEESDVSDRHVFMNPKKYFWLASGTVIRNIYELSDALKIMDDDLFKSHVNENKNDFANWVKNVFKNEHLGDKLSKAKTKKEMIDILEVFL